MQLKKSYIATNFGRKSATTFGDLPDCWERNGMTCWCCPKYVMTHEMCSTCSIHELMMHLESCWLLYHSGWTTFHPVHKTPTLCTKWFVHQANAAGAFIVNSSLLPSSVSFQGGHSWYIINQFKWSATFSQINCPNISPDSVSWGLQVTTGWLLFLVCRVCRIPDKS